MRAPRFVLLIPAPISRCRSLPPPRRTNRRPSKGGDILVEIALRRVLRAGEQTLVLDNPGAARSSWNPT